MKCGEFARLRDGNVITQTVELLRTAVLRIKQFKGQRFDKGFAFRAFSYGMRIHALIAVPVPASGAKGPRLARGIGVRRILGIKYSLEYCMEYLPFCSSLSESRPTSRCPCLQSASHSRS